MTDLRNVQRLADWSGRRDIGLRDFHLGLAGADDFARRLGRALLYDDADDGEPRREQRDGALSQHFDWLKAHDVNAAVIIGIMLVVAFFNMTSALLILVLERTRMIGLLKAFGMRTIRCGRCFSGGRSVTLRGLAWGNAAGLAVSRAEIFHVVKLSSEGYLLSEVPVALGWGWWLALNAGVVAIVALLVVPACIVSTVNPTNRSDTNETVQYRTDQERGGPRDVRQHRAEVRPAEPYALDEHRPHLARRRVVRIVRRRRPHRILDVATGTGDLAIEMAPHPRRTGAGRGPSEDARRGAPRWRRGV